MKSPYRPHVRRLLLITTFAGLLFFAKLGAPGLHDPDETRYAEIAREMLESGDFVVPHLNYVPYLDKPPLLYWATCLAFKLFGLTEFAARFVPAFSGLLCVIAVYLFGCVMVGESAAFRSAVVLATSIIFFFVSRMLVTDMLLTLLITLATGFLYLSRERGPRWLIPAYIAMALGALTKGPVAVLLPAIPVGFLAVKAKGIRSIRSLVSVGAVLAFLAVWLPWHVAIYYARPEFYGHFFLSENLAGFFREGIHHVRPAYHTVAYLLAGLIPWTMFLPAAIWDAFSRRGNRPDAVALCLAWAGTVVLLFSLSVSKLPTYVLPALPPLALLIGVAIAEKRETPLVVRIVAFLLGAVFCVLAVLAAVFVAPRFLGITPEIRNLCSLVIGILAALGVLLALSADRLAFVLAAGAVPAAFLLVVFTHSPQFLEYRSPRAIAAIIRERNDATRVACFDRHHPYLCFYLQQRQTLVDSMPSDYRLGLSLNPRNDCFLSSRKFMREVQTHAGIYCIVEDKNLITFQERFGPCFRLVSVFLYDRLEYLFVNTLNPDGEVARPEQLPDWDISKFLRVYGYQVKEPQPDETLGGENPQ
ncbi:MAG: glycosyltransferase family 39 protein [Planctomycetota bacterium]